MIEIGLMVLYFGNDEVMKNLSVVAEGIKS